MVTLLTLSPFQVSIWKFDNHGYTEKIMEENCWVSRHHSVKRSGSLWVTAVDHPQAPPLWSGGCICSCRTCTPCYDRISHELLRFSSDLTVWAYATVFRTKEETKRLSRKPQWLKRISKYYCCRFSAVEVLDVPQFFISIRPDQLQKLLRDSGDELVKQLWGILCQNAGVTHWKQDERFEKRSHLKLLVSFICLTVTQQQRCDINDVSISSLKACKWKQSVGWNQHLPWWQSIIWTLSAH